MPLKLKPAIPGVKNPRKLKGDNQSVRQLPEAYKKPQFIDIAEIEKELTIIEPEKLPLKDTPVSLKQFKEPKPVIIDVEPYLDPIIIEEYGPHHPVIEPQPKIE